MIGHNIQLLRDRIINVCNSAGRNSQDVEIILVSKTISVQLIREAYNAGIRNFGENKVQELLSKYTLLPDDIVWHFIGHLQNNKVKQIIDKVALIHSVDSIDLVAEIQKRSETVSKKVSVLLQVNVSNEDSKFGIDPSLVEEFIEQLRCYDRVTLCGFMTIGPYTDDYERIRRCFEILRHIRDGMQQKFPQYDLRRLSMGMSNDYEIAIHEGATDIRIGTAVFGDRHGKI